jgi:carbamoyl-phosphate synthase small subunit
MVGIRFIKCLMRGVLVLSCGLVLFGRSNGSRGFISGELTFNTAMTGYQEALTDPSYHNQALLFTYPHIGNTGINIEDMESKHFHPSAFITRAFGIFSSGLRSQTSFINIIKSLNTILLTGVDTRSIMLSLKRTKKKWCCIITNTNTIILALNLVKVTSLEVLTFNLISESSITSSVAWFYKRESALKGIKYIIVLDFGSKLGIFRNVIKRGYVPVGFNPYSSLSKVYHSNVKGLLISNGPCNPGLMKMAISNIKCAMFLNLPALGICLGHQILSAALGLVLERLKVGHHSINHPVKDLTNKRVFITSQNHNFSVSVVRVVDRVRVTYISLFDESVQGIESYKHPIISLQGHPEASPGPKDIEHVFDHYMNMLELSVTRNAQKRRYI